LQLKASASQQPAGQQLRRLHTKGCQVGCQQRQVLTHEVTQHALVNLQFGTHNKYKKTLRSQPLLQYKI
jgi:hypothetical protein